MTGRLFAALGALAIATTPIAAHAADASKLSLASAAQDEGSGEGGSSAGIIAGVIGVGIVAIAALGLTVGEDNDDDESPASP